MILYSLALLDKAVLSRGEAALEGRPEDGSAQLGGEARGVTEDLPLNGHLFSLFFFFSSSFSSFSYFSYFSSFSFCRYS